MSGFLQEFGVINGCHVRPKASVVDADDYISWKNYHAIVLQNLLDNSYLFRDIIVVRSGGSQDTTVSL